MSILERDFPKTRSEVISILTEHNIDSRPIVTGNFVNNKVLDYFDFEIHENMVNADNIDTNGFFVGNHQNDLTSEINYLYEVLSNI